MFMFNLNIDVNMLERAFGDGAADAPPAPMQAEHLGEA
jgi:hypothetical protein